MPQPCGEIPHSLWRSTWGHTFGGISVQKRVNLRAPEGLFDGSAGPGSSLQTASRRRILCLPPVREQQNAMTLTR
jgi:hypothetical protein